MALPWGREQSRAATTCRATGDPQRFKFRIGDDPCRLLLLPTPNGHGVHVEYRTVSGMLLTELHAVSRVQPFGGVQWYLVCPVCVKNRRRVHLLHKRLLAGAACRACHALFYVTQRMATVDRLRHRTRTLYAKAEGCHWTRAPDPHDGCEAPSSPRFRKVSRAQAEWARWAAACDQLDRAWLAEADRTATKLLSSAPAGMRHEIASLLDDAHGEVAASRRHRGA